MAKTPEIRNLKEFLEPSLDGLTIVDYSSKFLTSPGDNYGSTMLALSVNCLDKNDEVKLINVVAKMCPVSAEYRVIFQTDITFEKEFGVYKDVIPAATKFQIEMGVPKGRLLEELICHCYTGRISLNPKSDKLDEDALMVFENLAIKNFITEDRIKGFSDKVSCLILEKLALFHATFIAMRHHKPELFQDKVMKYLNHVDIQDALGDEFKKMAMNMFLGHVRKTNLDKEVAEKFANTLEAYATQKHTSATSIQQKGLSFSTFVHNDFWTNNMMIRYDDNGNQSEIKILDFQLTIYDSAARDLLFFILTSIEDSNLEDNFDRYINIYHKSFNKALTELKVPLDEFNLSEELKRIAPLEVYHIISMFRVTLASKNALVKEHEDMKVDSYLQDNLVGEDYFKKIELVGRIYHNKNWF